MLVLLPRVLVWLHSELDSAIQRLLEENNQVLIQITANIETFNAIFMYTSHVCGLNLPLLYSSVSHKVYCA